MLFSYAKEQNRSKHKLNNHSINWKKKKNEPTSSQAEAAEMPHGLSRDSSSSTTPFSQLQLDPKEKETQSKTDFSHFLKHKQQQITT